MRCPEKLSYQVVEMPQSLGRAGNPPYSELTCQPDRGILRAMDGAGSGTVKTGRSGAR